MNPENTSQQETVIFPIDWMINVFPVILLLASFLGPRLSSPPLESTILYIEIFFALCVFSMIFLQTFRAFKAWGSPSALSIRVISVCYQIVILLVALMWDPRLFFIGG